MVADFECISRLCVRLKIREVLLTESFKDVSSDGNKNAVLDGVVAAQPGRLKVPHRLRRSWDGFTPTFQHSDAMASYITFVGFDMTVTLHFEQVLEQNLSQIS